MGEIVLLRNGDDGPMGTGEKLECIMGELRSYADSKNVEGMARFGISSENTLGVSVVKLRAMAKRIGKDHTLALALWDTGIHEARILASLVDVAKEVTEAQIDAWVLDFDSWDVCDQCCMNLFDKTPYAYFKAVEWSQRQEEFVARAGFALMAALAWHDKKASDDRFTAFLPYIIKGSDDGWNYVKKAVSWALRHIGKRNARLNEAAIETAIEIKARPSKSARWIASDALRELQSSAVRTKLGLE